MNNIYNFHFVPRDQSDRMHSLTAMVLRSQRCVYGFAVATMCFMAIISRDQSDRMHSLTAMVLRSQRCVSWRYVSRDQSDRMHSLTAMVLRSQRCVSWRSYHVINLTECILSLLWFCGRNDVFHGDHIT